MKKLLLFCMVFCLSFADGLAQDFDETKLETLTNEFIQKTNSSDAFSLMPTIKSYYEALSNVSKSKMRSYYMDKITSLLEKEQKEEALAIIYLYQGIVDEKDDKLPALLYVKGNIYTEKMDSIRLLQTIKELNDEIYRGNATISNYISTLNANMDKIRNYVPPYKKIDGIWVANGLIWDKGKKDKIYSSFSYGRTDIYMQIEYDQHADIISSYIKKESDIASQIDGNMGTLKQKDYYSQLIFPYASDSLYILWSSEKIDKKNPIFAEILREAVSTTAAAVSAELEQSNKHSYSSQLLGGLATTAVEFGINTIISALFTPTKSMYVLEARLKIINEYIITGTLTYKYKLVAADGSVYENRTLNSKVSLLRWLPNSNITFTDYWINPILHPLSNLNTKEYKKNKTTRWSYCREKFITKAFPQKSASAYNVDQYKWLMLYNDSILRSQGYHGKFAINDDFRPYLGVLYSSLDTKMQKKTKLNEGVYIYEVDDMSAAYVGGLKKGDIILSINDQKMKDRYDMDTFIFNMRPGDWFRVKVLRGKKQLELLVRVTWK